MAKTDVRIKTLDDYWKMRAERNYTYPRRDGGPCDWCERFRESTFRVCINCGAILQ